jgi:hypothetical protein
MLPGRWVVGAEYLYVNFGNVSTTSFGSSGGVTFTNPFTHSANLNANIARARLSKLF